MFAISPENLQNLNFNSISLTFQVTKKNKNKDIFIIGPYKTANYYQINCTNCLIYLDNEMTYFTPYFSLLGKGAHTINMFINSKLSSLSNFFKNCKDITYIDVSKLQNVNLFDLSSTFSKCYNLKNIKGLENLCTRNVKFFNFMFANCYKIKNLNLENFNTENAEYLEGMFSDCRELIEIKGVENFNTTRCVNFNFMFCGCWNLLEINAINFDFSRAKNAQYFMAGCVNLRKIRVNWNVNNECVGDNFFYGKYYYEGVLEILNENHSNMIKNLPKRFKKLKIYL